MICSNVSIAFLALPCFEVQASQLLTLSMAPDFSQSWGYGGSTKASVITERNDTSIDKLIQGGTSGSLLVPPLLVAGLTLSGLPGGLSGQVLTISKDGDPTTSLVSVSLSSLIITLSVQWSEICVRSHFVYSIQLVGEQHFSNYIWPRFFLLLVNSSMMWPLVQDEILNHDQQAMGGSTELGKQELFGILCRHLTLISQ